MVVLARSGQKATSGIFGLISGIFEYLCKNHILLCEVSIIVHIIMLGSIDSMKEWSARRPLPWPELPHAAFG